ncbi:anthrax toxin-like adenylyl cyclase domain-containing protein [Pseudomonas sp. D1-1]|uniref:anthrax toxin-like adenylyl cyclase domain-containing protein n=1 Tax=Pseudomonas sp. D1-1 TaxID=1040793 RepID=UPI003DA8C4C2
MPVIVTYSIGKIMEAEEMNRLGPTGWNQQFSFNPGKAPKLEHATSVSPRPLTEVVREDIKKVSQQTGISAEHLHQLHAIARRHQCVIAFRPVDPHNAQLIEMGYPTKGLNIKGKSSMIGPLFGFIPVKQQLCGKGSTASDDIEKANLHVEQCVANGHAVKVPLELPAARMDYLKQHDLIRALDPPAFESTREDGSTFSFTAEETTSGNYRIATQGQVVEVLAPKIQPHGEPARPFTADYDLLFLMPQWDDVPQQSQRRGSATPAAPNEQPFNIGVAHIRSKYENVAPTDTQDSHPPVDYLTRLEERVINDINHELRGELKTHLNMDNPSDWNLVHHGSDEGNPGTNMRNNFPATVVAPQALGEFGAITVLPDMDRLNEFLVEARDARGSGRTGYVLVGNRQWLDDELKTNVTNRSQEIMRKLSSPSSFSPPETRRGSTASGEGSRRGSHISQPELDLLRGAAERRRAQSGRLPE